MAQQQGQDGGGGQLVVGPNIRGNVEEYRLERLLMKGLFGGVYEAKGLKTGKEFAVKVLHQTEIRKAQQADANEFCEVPMSEIQFLKEMSDSVYLMEVKDHFKDAYCNYIVFELAAGGDLLEALKHRINGFEEYEAQFLIGQAAKGLAVLHERRLAMQDVSLENMLVSYKEDGQYQVKLCDPGQARVFEVDRSGQELQVEWRGFVGKSFRPPELQLQKPYLASKIDAWCLGWSTFYLLAAQPLFLNAAETDEDWNMFSRGTVKRLFELKGASRCTKECMSFILGLMDLDPRLRLGVTQSLSHEWLTDPNVRPMYLHRHPATAPSPQASNGSLPQAGATLATSPSRRPVNGSSGVVSQGGNGASGVASSQPPGGQSGSVQAPAVRSGLSPDAGRAGRFRHPQINGRATQPPVAATNGSASALGRAASRAAPAQAPSTLTWRNAPGANSRSESPTSLPATATSALPVRQPQLQQQQSQQAGQVTRALSPFAAVIGGGRDENQARQSENAATRPTDSLARQSAQLGTPRRPDQTAARSMASLPRTVGGSASLASQHETPLTLGNRTAQYALPTPTSNGTEGGNSPSGGGYSGSAAALLGGASSCPSVGGGESLASGNCAGASASRAMSGQNARQQQFGSSLGDAGGHGGNVGPVPTAGAGSIRTNSPMQAQYVLRSGAGQSTTNSRGYSPGPSPLTALGQAQHSPQRTGSPMQHHGAGGVPAVIGAGRNNTSGSALIDNASGGHYWHQSPRPASPGSTIIRQNEAFARGRSTTRTSSPSQVPGQSPANFVNAYSNPPSPLVRAVSPVVAGVPMRGGDNRITWNPAPVSPLTNKRAVSPMPMPSVSGITTSSVPKWAGGLVVA